jgi:hypothetical protein
LFLSKEIYSVLVPKGKAALDKFLTALRSLAGSFGYDPIASTPIFDVKLGDIRTQEGKAIGVTSVAFVKKHTLKSPSSIQYAINTLLEKQLLTYHNDGRTKVYRVSDRFMEMWICRTY